MNELREQARSTWRSHLYASLLLLAFPAGCANQPTTVEYVAPLGACCKSISEFQFRPFAPGSEVEFSLTPTEASYTFADKRQHFIALQLPDNFSATTIQVRSFLSTSFLPLATAVLPDFVYLNSDLNVIGKSSTGGTQAGGGFWRGSVIGRVQVPQRTRYVVVTAGTSSSTATVHSENGTPHQLPSAALGDFTLRLFGDSGSK